MVNPLAPCCPAGNSSFLLIRHLSLLLFFSHLIGCGTTRWSDTSRTGTEQLVLTGAVEQSISEISFGVLKGQKVFLDTQFLDTVLDKGFIISTMRQQMISQGCILKTEAKDADYIVEARAMTGTNHQDLLFGVPQTTLPNMNVPGVPTAIPELSLAKSTTQKGVAKIAVFAYQRETGTPVWQSGSYPVASSAKDMWILGTGPWQRGTIYSGTHLAGTRLNPYDEAQTEESAVSSQNVTSEQFFEEAQRLVKTQDKLDHDSRVEEIKQSSAAKPASQMKQVGATGHSPGKAAQINDEKIEFEEGK